jgi:transcriptional regulator with XRE-family HTH domain
MDQAETSRSLGAVIKARRQELEWTQEELAERVIAHGDDAFRQSDVSRLERGKVGRPHRDRLAHIAAVLGLSPGELLARSGWAGADRAFAAAAPAMLPHQPCPSPCSLRRRWIARRCRRVRSPTACARSSPRRRQPETARCRSWPGARRRGPSTTSLPITKAALGRDARRALRRASPIDRAASRRWSGGLPRSYRRARRRTSGLASRSTAG